MNFCQKHRNHHCVHDHNCHNHTHKQMMKNNTKISNYRQVSSIVGGSQNLHKIVEENQEDAQCHFNSKYDDINMNKKCTSCQRIQKELVQKNKETQQLKKQHNLVQKKYSKACDENRQLQGVIQYYREELDRIVKCGELDLKNEIKRHLKQNTELAARNKFLLIKLNEMSELLQKLTNQVEQTQKKLVNERKQKQQITLNFNKLLEKLKKKQSEESSKQSDSQAEKKKHGQIETKYQIIIEEINRNLENSARENKKLFNQNKQLAKNVELLKQKLVNNDKLFKMEQEAATQKEIVLKKKLEGSQKENKQLRQGVAKLQQALKLKQEELVFSKKVVQKQLKIIKENKQIFQQVKADVDIHHKETQPGLTQNRDLENRQDHKKSDQQINQLKNEIKMLREKIVVLEGKGGGHSSETIEQYIMTIGASEAFKRIIEQKNTFIKKLIRQKGALLQKM